MNDSYKFINLYKFFSKSSEYEIKLTFKQIEDILGFKMTSSAYTHRAYWHISATHTFPKCWTENGYNLTYLDLDLKTATFSRNASLGEKKKTYEKITLLQNIIKKSDISISEVIDSIKKYYFDLESDENSRYVSWEHCYRIFQTAHNIEELTLEDVDLLSLHLGFYLASWGMLRGSSFLLYKDYKVHTETVKELLKPCYYKLWNIEYSELQNKDNLDVLMELVTKLRAIYRSKRQNVKDASRDVSDTLITKILLGTLGCTPAYDEYFKEGISKHKITIKFYNKDSVLGLAKYYQENVVELEEIRKSISKARCIVYPQMKILDMAFWQLGFDRK